MEVLPNRKHQNRTKNEELKLLQTGSNQPWERCTPEVFAQHFHQAVLKSTQKKQTKNGKTLKSISLFHKKFPLRSLISACHLVVKT